MPLSYLVGLIILAITLVPILFVILGGFRTSAQLNSSPTGLPHPWVLANYRTILTTASFWQNLFTTAR